jgi:glucose-6-phosphate dehydrogenase assembly protein OpcA
MARTIADRSWRTTTPDAVEAELSALWREIGVGETPVARAVMSNLIVFRNPSTVEDLAALVQGLPIEEVAARHPSRLIVLEHCRRDTPRAPSSAAVGILTFGPAQARYGVELIVVRSACPEPSLLSILRRFVRGDIPTSVWWTEDLSASAPADALLTVGRQLVYDSRRWRDVRRGIAALAPLVAIRRVDLADVNWRRVAPLIRAIVHVRGPITSDAWRRDPIRVAHRHDEAAIAWLFAGWVLANRPEGEPQIEVEALPETTDAADERRPLLTVTVGELTATLTPHSVEVISSGPPMTVGVARESESDAVAAELRSLSMDPALADAIAALVDLFAKA